MRKAMRAIKASLNTSHPFRQPWVPILTVMWVLLGLPADLRGEAEHVLVVVWDGMRPDFITAELTPTLDALARRGTFFRNHHSSFITSTEVNGAALATGMYPNRNGILANTEYRPELGWLSGFGTESLDAIRRGDLLTGGHYLEAATIAQILQEAGFPTMIAGAKPVVLLQDRASGNPSPAQAASVTLFRGQTLPKSIKQSLVSIPEVGPFPGDEPAGDSARARVTRWVRSGQDKVFLKLYGVPRTTATSRQIDMWTTRALVHGLWRDGVPKYSLLWLSEPDASQHPSSPGSRNAVEGLALCDQNLAFVLEALKAKGVLDRTDVLVVSDHGFSTIDRAPDLIKGLKKAGFTVGKTYDNPATGDVLVIPLGGSVLYYVFNRDSATIQRLVDYLQTSGNAGVIFSSAPIEGTFPLSQVRLDARCGAPDVIASMPWTEERNVNGTAGMLTAPDGKRGRGAHASLSPFDLHNTLVAAGPDFKPGFLSETASGNVDVAPTVLAVLGVKPPMPMDGRVLSEALVGVATPAFKPEEKTMEASRDLGGRVWRQWLKFTEVGQVIYFDRGNGQSKAKP